jgi:hypothetical protein
LGAVLATRWGRARRSSRERERKQREGREMRGERIGEREKNTGAGGGDLKSWERARCSLGFGVMGP